MKKLLMTAALALVALTSCQMIKANVPGVPTSGSDLVNSAAAASGAAGDLAKVKECISWGDREVPYPEEYAIGGAVALALADKQGAVHTELSPDVEKLDATQLKALGTRLENDGKKVTPGTGPKTDLNKYVNGLGLRLAALSERPTINWTFAVLDSDAPNAFSAPGGYVFVTTGMLKAVENEAQLAGVLAHEIGHVTGKHALNAYKSSKRFSCFCGFFGGKALDAGTKGAMGAVGELKQLPFAGEVVKAVGAASFNPNSLGAGFIEHLTDKASDTIFNEGLGKGPEFDADRTAARIMVFAGYDTKEFEKLLSKMPDGGGFLTPHPSNAERIKAVSDARTELADFASGLKAPALPAQVKALK